MDYTANEATIKVTDSSGTTKWGEATPAGGETVSDSETLTFPDGDAFKVKGGVAWIHLGKWPPGTWKRAKFASASVEGVGTLPKGNNPLDMTVVPVF